MAWTDQTFRCTMFCIFQGDKMIYLSCCLIFVMFLHGSKARDGNVWNNKTVAQMNTMISQCSGREEVGWFGEFEMAQALGMFLIFLAQTVSIQFFYLFFQILPNSTRFWQIRQITNLPHPTSIPYLPLTTMYRPWQAVSRTLVNRQFTLL